MPRPWSFRRRQSKGGKRQDSKQKKVGMRRRRRWEEGETPSGVGQGCRCVQDHGCTLSKSPLSGGSHIGREKLKRGREKRKERESTQVILAGGPSWAQPGQLKKSEEKKSGSEREKEWRDCDDLKEETQQKDNLTRNKPEVLLLKNDMTLRIGKKKKKKKKSGWGTGKLLKKQESWRGVFLNIGARGKARKGVRWDKGSGAPRGNKGEGETIGKSN